MVVKQPMPGDVNRLGNVARCVTFVNAVLAKAGARKKDVLLQQYKHLQKT